ncbi:cytochrome P450 [Hyaloscypha sp. PMI_1271]|nr:cytochrome P450 [Hyaloscypha sp. PMI_1271]
MFYALAFLALSVSIIYNFVLIIYRLYFSPIAHFPGPKLAAATWWYQFYYDVIRAGTYMFKMKELHDIYGPVIRINPDELHVIEPEFLETLYPGHSRKRDKWIYYTGILATPGASMNTISHDLHRTRRSALNPFFSKASIRKLQPLIDSKVDQFLERIDELQNPVNLNILLMFADVVTEFCFGMSYNRLGDPNFDPSFQNRARAGIDLLPFLASFPFIMRTLEALPQFITSLLSPDYGDYIAEKKEIQAEATKALLSPEGSFNNGLNRTIFHEILDSKLPEEEKTLDRLGDEAAVTLAAGTLTTAWVLSVAIYYLTTRPTILEKLKSELTAAIPDPSSYTPLPALESLPYLRACVQEAIRLGYGAPGRVCHVAPTEPMILKHDSGEMVIPPGTPTSMTVYLMNHVESVFPDSHNYRPERWLEKPRLDKYLFSFSKGSRGCAGRDLAYAELTLAIARIFRSYGSMGCRHSQDRGVLQPFKTDDRDVTCVAAMILPKVWSGTKGVRMKIRK